MARLFFALWPDDGARSQLSRVAVDLAHRLGGRAVEPARIHLTLAFLGEVAAPRAAAAVAAAQGIESCAFTLTLDEVGCFPRAGVGWAGASRPPPQLQALALLLATRLREDGFVLEDRAFAPHVTLARRIRRSAQRAPMAPVAWEAQSFALVETDARTGRYATREWWSLGTR